jgi:selenocysteine-specific elongation factor
MRVIGTAGHVDHGKSTLVEALTGTHPDRLKEEREREMTIDLGFAWLSLPNGEEVGVVDVPGHRDFIENMLAGIGGIDATLFVVAADEGVMPQTREHLAILDLLQIDGGVVALTKIDLVDDPEWLDLVESDLMTVLSGTVLADAPIVRVSARTRTGMDELVTALESCLADRPARPDLGKPRLPIDRTFTIAGFGSVVTGTLSDGQLKLGEEVEVLPQGLRGRVRGLQTHKKQEEVAVPGSRTAVNVSGIALEQIERGNVLAHPGDYQPTRRLDARFCLLADASAPLQHNTEVKLYIGATEVVSRLRLLGSEQLLPGEEGWLQLELKQPIVTVRGDRYILRRPSPGETLGGGKVVDAHPAKRHKRFSTQVIQRLEALSQGTPAEVLQQALLTSGAVLLKDALAQASLDADASAQAVQELFETGQLLNMDSKLEAREQAPEQQLPRAHELVINRGDWERLAGETLRVLEDYHRAYPLRKGMPREELKSRLKNALRAGSPAYAQRLFNNALRRLAEEGTLVEQGPLVSLPGHSIRFTPAQQNLVNDLLKRFAAAPYTPPSVKECQAAVSEDVFQALLDLEELLTVSPEVVFRKSDYQRMLGDIRQMLGKEGTITAAQVRDHFNTSRKYALALLEHLDAVGVTVREGDVRRLKK